MNEFAPMVNQAAQQFGVPPELLMAQLSAESTFNPKAVGDPVTVNGKTVRAQGIAQMLPETAKSLGVDPTKPDQAINGMARLMAENLKRYGNEADAVQAYHGGTNKDNWGPKTQAYRDKVMKMYHTDKLVNSDPDMQLLANFKPQPSLAGDVPDALKGDADYDMLANFKPTKPAKAAPVAAVSTPEAPEPKSQGAFNDFASAVTHHMGSGALGAVQLGANALNYAGADNGQFTNKLNAGIAQREQDYQASVPNNTASYAGALLGEVANPFTAVPAAKAAKAYQLSKPLVRGAMAGMAGMATQPVTEGNYLTGKLKQEAAGAAGGAVIDKAGTALVNKFIPKSRLEARAEQLMKDAGIEPPAGPSGPSDGGGGGGTPVNEPSFFEPAPAPLQPSTPLTQGATMENKLTAPPEAQEVKNRLVAAMRGGDKKPDVAAIQRAIGFEKSGVEPTVGQVTRDPVQYTFEREASKTAEGSPLAYRFSEQDQKLRQNLLDIGAGKAAPKYEAGNSAIERLTKLDAPKQQAVSDAYKAVRDSEGRAAELDATAFASEVESGLKKSLVSRFLPAEIKGIVSDVGEGSIPFDVSQSIEIDKVLNKAIRAANNRDDGNAAAAIGIVKSALEEAPLLNGYGEETLNLYKGAKELFKQRKMTIERTPALRAALDNVDPERYVDKYIVNATTKEMKALKEFVGDDPDMAEIVRTQVADYLRTKAFGVDAASSKQFAQESYNKAIKAIGREKLETFFSPEEVSKLEAWGRTAANIHSRPSGSAVNESNSASAVFNFLSDVTGAGAIAKQTVGKIVQKNKISNALEGAKVNKLKAE